MALDASGSVGNQEIAEMSVELMDILALRQDSLRVLWFDTQVASDQEIEYGDDATALRPAGGGGTDFIAPFAHLEEEGTQPECVVLLTDGECASYPDLPPYPVIWGVVKNGRKDFDPPFGRVLYLD
jgi:predicted metal-dependent peptidase